MLLSLLVVVFAVEAKLAWFGPDGSPTAQISAAKLQPANAPRIAAPSDALSFPAAWIPQVAVVLTFVLVWRRVRALPRFLSSYAVPGSPRFYSSFFFRPPPGS